MNTSSFDWAVLGAGPAGISAVGKLIDNGIEPKKIAWIDPAFKVGDFGSKWRNVSSNTRINLFIKFLYASPAFNYVSIAKNFEIETLDPLSTCPLAIAADPLQAVSDHLRQTTIPFHSTAQHLQLQDRTWEITLQDKNIYAKNVILATGSEPKSLGFPGIEEIPMTTALDPLKLVSSCNSEDVIAVFGASHSAIIILKTLLEQCRLKQVINFYLSPLQFAVYFDDWILFDNTGLKGETAAWAKQNINGALPEKLIRIISNEENIRNTLPSCNKAIYATGFQKRLIPVKGIHSLEHNDRTGIIAPGLFGLGIAFPEAKTDPYGQTSHQVGVWKFMDYITRILPLWMQYGL